jgi:hypothetical protein
MLTIVLYLRRNHPLIISIASIGTLLIVIGAAAVLADAFFIHLDAQGSLVILFLPIYQWLAALLLLLICFVMGALLEKSQNLRF